MHAADLFMSVPQSLTRLVYASRSQMASNDDNTVNADLARILMQSRKNNPANQLVGALYYSDGCFFQCLEGPSDAVEALYAKLHHDKRHYDLKVLSRSPITQLAFTRWAMKFVPQASLVSDLLSRHRLDHFDPYSFSAQLQSDMVNLLVTGNDDQTAQIATPRLSPQAAPTAVQSDSAPHAQRAQTISIAALIVACIALAVAIIK
jgi:hypothetical protein